MKTPLTIGLCIGLLACSEGSAGLSSTQADLPIVAGPLPPGPIERRCEVDQPFPYFDSPYPGLHGNAGNNERVPCPGPLQPPTPGWSALEGYIVFNPVTVSDRGVYAIVTHTTDCRLRFIPFDGDGTDQCLLSAAERRKLSFGALGSAPELDEAGNIYLTDGWQNHPDQIVSYTSTGTLRWRKTFTSIRRLDTYEPPLGVHFTPQGYVATVTRDGIVVLLDMDGASGPGEVPIHLDLINDTFLAPVRPPDREPIVGGGPVPVYVLCRLQEILGPDLSPQAIMSAMSGGSGNSGSYTDNTIGGSGDLLFVAGGGPEMDDGLADDGALVAVRIVEGAEGPILEPAWFVRTESGTGASPTVDPTGRYVMTTEVVNDHAVIAVADIRACNEGAEQWSLDAPVDPAAPPALYECPRTWQYALDGRSLSGSISMDGRGVVYAWNEGSTEPDDNELVALQNGRLLWGVDFSREWGPEHPNVRTEWTSTALILDNMVIGTVSHYETDSRFAGLPLATWTQHELVAVNRFTGGVIWRDVAAEDDAFNSPLMGPDGNIYVPTFGAIDLAKKPDPEAGPFETCEEVIAAGDDFQGGIQQFVVPVERRPLRGSPFSRR